MKLKSQKGKKIGIFGLGLTGRSAFSALDKVAKTILCWDDLEANRNNFISQSGSQSLKDITEKDWNRRTGINWMLCFFCVRGNCTNYTLLG